MERNGENIDIEHEFYFSFFREYDKRTVVKTSPLIKEEIKYDYKLKELLMHIDIYVIGHHFG